MKPRLFIGIPCYQDSPILQSTLAHLRARTVLPHVLEVKIEKQSVVDNKNALLQKAKTTDAEYFCLCDDDIEPAHGWDRDLISGIESANMSGAHVGQSSPRIIYPDGSVCFMWVNIYFDPENRNHTISSPPNVVDVPLLRKQALVGGLPGTLTIFTRAFLDSVCWKFDNRYPKSQYEDVDQSLTCRDKGFRLLYNGAVKVTHHSSQLNPRSTDNYQRLVAKWEHRTDLTMVIPPTEAALAMHAPGQKRSPGLFQGMWCLMQRNPFHRIATGFRVLRRNGIRGIKAHCDRILVESRIDDASDKATANTESK